MTESKRRASKPAATLTARQAARQRGYSITDYRGGVRARIEFRDANGERTQRTKLCATADEANQWAQDTLASIRSGEYLDKRPDTFNAFADEWLRTKTDEGVRPVTVRGYGTALNPARKAFGTKPVQDVTPADVRELLRSRAGQVKTTNRLLLVCVRGALGLALADGVIKTDPTARVKVTGKASARREELLASDADRIKAKIVGDRLEACWTLTLAGLRRSEAMGVRWSDLDLEAGTLTVERGRVDLGRAKAGDLSATTAPKSERSRRTLPLTPDMLAAIKRTRSIRQQEHLRLGASWREASFLAVDEAMTPLRPEVYSDMWKRLTASAKCEKPCTLHGARHGSATRMLDQGVPVHIVAAWHGHDPAVTLRTYAHTDLEGLRQAGRALEVLA